MTEERERKRQLALDPSTPVDALRILADDPDPSVRAAVAARRAPLYLLRSLADDPRAEVRAAVAANPSTPRGVLLDLAHDRSKLVRFWLTVQKDRELLQILARDPDRLTASAARSALDQRRLYRRLLEVPARRRFRRAMQMVERERGF